MEEEYTKLEIKLYEKLTQVSLAYKKFSEEFLGSISDVKNNKKMKDTFTRFIELGAIMGNIKIPKKFLILNRLKDKNGKEN